MTSEYAFDNHHGIFTGTGALDGVSGHRFTVTVEDNARQSARGPVHGRDGHGLRPRQRIDRDREGGVDRGGHRPAMFNGVHGYTFQTDWDAGKRTLYLRIWDATGRQTYDSKPSSLTSGSCTFVAK